ncbi:MAG: dipeptidase [Candidatus Kariarchaeaceae archaeon]|jgi:membrane dipeptidase
MNFLIFYNFFSVRNNRYEIIFYRLIMYIDTHLDTLWAMKKDNRVFSVSSDKGHVDLQKAERAELVAGFFTGFPSDNQYITEKMLRDWLLFVNDSENRITRILNYRSLERLVEQKKQQKNIDAPQIGAVLHLEGTAGIDTELNRLYIYYNCGLRSVGVTWNEQNQFATGVGKEADKTRGFTKEGLDLVSALEDLGVLIDVSHLNDKSFWDLMDHSNIPVFASHSNLRKFADHPRNLTDDMVIAISDSGGTVGINFCSGFLSTKETHPPNKVCAMEMIGEVINLTNSSSVNIGSDFDGCTLPDDMHDITDTNQFFKELQGHLSLTNDELEKIQYRNVMRIANEVWK